MKQAEFYWGTKLKIKTAIFLPEWVCFRIYRKFKGQMNAFTLCFIVLHVFNLYCLTNKQHTECPTQVLASFYKCFFSGIFPIENQQLNHQLSSSFFFSDKLWRQAGSRKRSCKGDQGPNWKVGQNVLDSKESGNRCGTNNWGNRCQYGTKVKEETERALTLNTQRQLLIRWSKWTSM